jgi:hypothetical protein
VRQEIERAVAPLVGRPLWASGRAADMECFQFGDRHTRVIQYGRRRGDTVEEGEYKLHVQCAWRIVRGDEVLVGGHDLYYPADESAVPPEDFDWDHEPNLRGRRIEALFANSRSFLVHRVDVGVAGALRIDLGEEHALELFPEHSRVGEHWRLFRLEEPHFVVTGAGIER